MQELWEFDWILADWPFWMSMVVVGYNLLVLGILFWWAYDGCFLFSAVFDQKTCDFEIKSINLQNPSLLNIIVLFFIIYCPGFLILWGNNFYLQ